MKKWEYRIWLLPKDAPEAQRDLDEAGSVGWELIQIVQQRGGSLGVFKRPKGG